MEEEIKHMIIDSMSTRQSLLDNISGIKQAAKLILGAINSGNKVLICGNGGSASQAQHFAGELVGRFEKERKAIACVSLTTDTSILTSLSNDYSFDMVFARQIEALGNNGDILIGLSTSGNSKNIIQAEEQALKQGIKIINLLGKGGGKLREVSGTNIIIKSDNTARIQEAHILILHILAKLVENAI